jgi:hypothetical protein
VQFSGAAQESQDCRQQEFWGLNFPYRLLGVQFSKAASGGTNRAVGAIRPALTEALVSLVKVVDHVVEGSVEL